MYDSLCCALLKLHWVLGPYRKLVCKQIPCDPHTYVMQNLYVMCIAIFSLVIVLDAVDLIMLSSIRNSIQANTTYSTAEAIRVVYFFKCC